MKSSLECPRCRSKDFFVSTETLIWECVECGFEMSQKEKICHEIDQQLHGNKSATADKFMMYEGGL